MKKGLPDPGIFTQTCEGKFEFITGGDELRKGAIPPTHHHVLGIGSREYDHKGCRIPGPSL